MAADPFARWPDLDRLFTEALELAPEERKAFLDDACGDRDELRAELQRLVDAHGVEDEFLAVPLSWPAGALTTTADSTALSGGTVAHYEVLGLLGTGGMGVVYKARDTKLDRLVTLKFLQRHLLADDTAKTRFIHEAKAASALDHGNICTVHEIGETGEGQLYIAMAYYDGETLKDRIARGPVPFDDAVAIAERIAAALERAHDAGIVHRDLKPANVMLTARGEVKLLDFGIAKLESDADLTEAGARVGTVAYMSPEQARGDPVDGRSDVWSLGVVLYEMVAGVRPFRGERAAAVIHSILHDEPAAVGALRSDAVALDDIVSRALTKDPEERVASMRECRVALKPLVRGSRWSNVALPAAGRSVWVARWRGITRTRWMYALIGVGAVGLVVGAAQFLPRGTVPFAERDWLLIADVDNQTRDSLFDGSLDELLRSSVGQSRHVNVFPPVRVRQALARMQRAPNSVVDEVTALEIAEREGIRVVLVPDLTAAGGAYALSARVVHPSDGVAFESFVERAPALPEVLEAVDRLARRVRRSLGESRFAVRQETSPLPRVTTASLRALKAWADGNRAWREGRLEQGAAAWEEATRYDSTFAQAHASLGMYYYQMNDRAKGDVHYDRALAHLDRLTRPEQLWIEAQAATARGDLDRSQAILQSYVDRFPDALDAWFNLGSSHMRLRRCNEADQAFDQVLRIDPTQARAHVQAATCRSATGDFAGALARYEQAFAIDSSLLVWRNVNNEYGFTLVKHGEADRAEAVFRLMMETMGRAEALRSLGLLEMYRGRMERAVAHLDESTSLYLARNAGLSALRNQLFAALASRAAGDRADLRARLDSATALTRSFPVEPYWLMLLGRLYAQDGDVVRAEEVFAALTSRMREVNRGDLAVRDLLLGEIHAARGALDDAVRAVAAAYANRDDGLVSEARARVLLLRGDTAAAIAQYERSVDQMGLGWEAQQPWIEAHVWLGRLYDARGDTAQAIGYMRRFAELWRDADPGVTPSPAVVRRRVEELTAGRR